MKILYISKALSGDDRSDWSGTSYQALRALRRIGFKVDYLCALRDVRPSLMHKLSWRYWSTVPHWLGKNIRCDESFYSVNLYKDTLHSFDFAPYDVIFIPTHISIVAALPQHIKAKVVHLADATVDSLFNYYTEFSNLLWHNYWEAHIIGKKAFLRSDLIIASSDWCKRNAVEQYGCNPTQIVVTEFGPNIEESDIPGKPKEIDGKRHLNVYWSGVNWQRKGGDVALACCEELISRGYDIQFHITGMRELPMEAQQKSFIQNHGFLNKNNPVEYTRLIKIMKEQDIFLFPSKAECSSIAVCEANGFGLPCFVYDTGGTGNYVINGENGFMLPLTADGKTFADRIEKSIIEKGLNELSKGACRHYHEHLNWNRWSEKVNKAILAMTL